MTIRFMTSVGDAPTGEVGDRWDYEWQGQPARYYLRSDHYWWRDERKDEDPRHQFCELAGDCAGLVQCHRCERSYVVLIAEWMEGQTPGWSSGTVSWDKVDPKRRTTGQAMVDFENTQCEGERRQRERWVP